VAKKKDKQPTRMGIFVHCSEEFKKRLDRARRYQGRTMKEYVVRAVLKEIEADEAEMSKLTRK
jgi:uncharacterized protein YjiK